jgi:hypothetical protein
MQCGELFAAGDGTLGLLTSKHLWKRALPDDRTHSNACSLRICGQFGIRKYFVRGTAWNPLFFTYPASP